MIIKNGYVFQEDGSFKMQELYIENGFFVESIEEVSDKTCIDAKGNRVIPGLIDIHTHGSYGHDFSDADKEGLKTISSYLYKHGIVAFCPTSMTLPEETLTEIFTTTQQALEENSHAQIVGINMEGPYLSREKKGAHVEEYIVEPDIAMFRRLNTTCDHLIKLVTLAPEVPGAAAFIDALSKETMISIGHTAASYDTALEAMKKGATHVTHLYNAMPSFLHRDPGVIGAASDMPDTYVELISDGYHIHPSVVRDTFKIFKDHVVLISDSMMATGMPDGHYELGGQEVIVENQKATLTDGTLAGSSTNLYDCMKKAISFGIDLSSALFAVTRNPAKSIGIDDLYGSIAVGKKAKVNIIGDDFTIIQTI